MDFDPDRVARSPFTIGAIGALITAARFTPGASWLERGFNAVAGAVIAGFLTPALTEWLEMTRDAYVNGAAFVIGLLGMSVVAALIQGARDLKLAEIVASWFGRGGGGGGFGGGDGGGFGGGRRW